MIKKKYFNIFVLKDVNKLFVMIVLNNGIVIKTKNV